MSRSASIFYMIEMPSMSTKLPTISEPATCTLFTSFVANIAAERL